MDFSLTNLAIVLLTLVAFYALVIYNAYLQRLRAISQAIPVDSETEPEDRTLRQLRARFLAAYSNLDQVNTLPLIEKLLATTRMSESGLMQGMSINYAEQMLRIVPNLLIGGGLLGTFAGLTQNLSSLQNLLGSSGTIAIEELQPMLGGMSTAFISSLFGLGYSLLLTVLFSMRSPLAYRRRLVLALEHYLDNVVPTLDTTRTPTSKAIAELGQEFKGFLAEFAGTVQQAIDSALRTKLDQIFETNAQLQQQAADVYRHLDAGSTRLLTSASRFEAAAETLNTTEFATILGQATARLEGSSQALTQSAKDLSDSFRKSSKQLTRAVELTERAEQQLQQVGVAVERATTVQSEVAEQMRVGLTKLTTASDRLKAVSDAGERNQQQQQAQAEQMTALLNELRQSIAREQSYREVLESMLRQAEEALTSSNRALSTAVEAHSQLIIRKLDAIPEAIAQERQQQLEAARNQMKQLMADIQTRTEERLRALSTAMDALKSSLGGQAEQLQQFRSLLQKSDEAVTLSERKLQEILSQQLRQLDILGRLR